MGVGQMVIFSQPRGDRGRGATMEGGEVQMTTDFLSDCTIILFLRRNSSVRKIKIIEPCWALITGYQLTKYSIAKA